MTEKRKIDNPAIRKAWEETEKFYSDITSKPIPGIYINDGQPGTGKTESLAKIIAKTDKKYAFFTANHHHLEKFEQDLKKYGMKESEYIHGGGFERLCENYPRKVVKDWTDSEKFIHKIHHRFERISSKILCTKCGKKSSCKYYEYTHNSKRYRITLQPLEFLFTSYNSDKDIFILDEAVTKNQRYLWDFSFSKLHGFIDQIEIISRKEYRLRDYFMAILDFHRELLRSTSLIFNEKPEILFKMDSMTFCSKEYKDRMFLQHVNLITHPETVSLSDCLFTDIPENIFELSREGKDDLIFGIANKQIIKTIAGKDDTIIDVLIENYIPILAWIEFLEIMFNKDPVGKICLIVSERLEQIPKSELPYKDKKIVSTEGNYEKGFIDEYPYVKNIISGDMIISRMGKEFEGVKENPDTLKDAWYTLGHPYLFKAYDIALEKPIVILDATYNKKIFETLLDQWFKFNSFLEFSRYPESKPEHVLKKYRKNVNVIFRTQIENKKSIVYDVEEHFPLISLRSGKIHDVIGFIATIIDDNPCKSYAIISHKEFEEKFKELFPKAVTAHHMDQRGKTIDCDLLFIVGTPYTPLDTCPFVYILTFNELPKNIKKKDTKRFTGYEDPLLQEILKVKSHDENYHELHRTRMLLYNRGVYALCELPDKIKDEVTVKKIPDMNTISRLALWNLMDIIIEYDGEDRLIIFEKEVKNRDIYKKAGGWRKLINDLEGLGYITLDKEKAKTRPRTIVYSTTKGKDFHRDNAKFYYKKR